MPWSIDWAVAHSHASYLAIEIWKLLCLQAQPEKSKISKQGLIAAEKPLLAFKGRLAGDFMVENPGI